MSPSGQPTAQGKVSFVGAGPGDPGLITVKGQEALRRAGAVAYELPLDPRLLAEVEPNAVLVSLDQRSAAERHALLERLAAEGQHVVRLVAGDPFLSPTVSVEAEALLAAGIAVEIVPGVSAASAVPAYAGIPVTYPGLATSLILLDCSGGAEPGTVVCNVQGDIGRVVGVLRAAGYSAETPIALIRNGTLPGQETLAGTLADIAGLARERQFDLPALAVVGAVITRREKLRWFDNRPLFGKRVLVTRAKEQAGSLAALLEACGAAPVELPAIATQPLPDYAVLDAAIERLSSYGWAIFTSVNGVAYFFARLKALRRDLRELKGVKLCAVGPATAKALEERGLLVDFVPEEYVAEGVIAGLLERGVQGARILLPRAREAREVIVKDLTEAGATVEEVPVYQTVRPAGSKERAAALFRQGAVDIVTFTSSSTVRNLVAMLDGEVALLAQATVACIGPITADTARELGIRVDVVAAEHTMPGLVRAIVEFEKEKRG